MIKHIIVMLFISTCCTARAESWKSSLVDGSKLSPVDELLLQTYPTLVKEKINKLTHSKVTTIKIYYTDGYKDIIYAVWKWKPQPFHWEFFKTTKSMTVKEMEDCLTKGIPEDMVHADFLLAQGDVGDYDGQYNKNITKVTKTKQANVQVHAKGFGKFSRYQIDLINNFHMQHNVKFAVQTACGDSCGDIYLFYEDGVVGQIQDVKYEVPNE